MNSDSVVSSGAGSGELAEMGSGEDNPKKQLLSAKEFADNMAR